MKSGDPYALTGEKVRRFQLALFGAAPEIMIVVTLEDIHRFRLSPKLVLRLEA